MPLRSAIKFLLSIKENLTQRVAFLTFLVEEVLLDDGEFPAFCGGNSPRLSSYKVNHRFLLASTFQALRISNSAKSSRVHPSNKSQAVRPARSSFESMDIWLAS
jgi:hypothetical protein